jgi:uncharacterized membrane protein
MYFLLADAVVVFHFLFIAFVVAGGLFVLRRPWVAWVHLPAAFWGACIEFAGLGGGSIYRGDFIEQYLVPVIYPSNLTAFMQYIFGGLVIAINLIIYGFVLYKHFFSKAKSSDH